MIQCVPFGAAHVDSLRAWQTAEGLPREDKDHLSNILAASATVIYAVLDAGSLVGAVVTNTRTEPPMLNLIWIHPGSRGGRVAVEATRQVLREMFRLYEVVGIWQPNPRMRQILVELGMDPKYDEPCRSIDFNRGELSLGQGAQQELR